MRDFEYRAPQTLQEAVGLLAENGREALPLAGGTDLIPQMDEGRKRPRLVIDVKKIPELTRLTFDERRGLRIGAAVPCSQVSEFPPVRERYPMLASACSLIGSVQIQNRASMGGNLCNAAPSADLAPPLICLGAEAVIVGPNGRRQMLVEDLFLGPGRTVLAPSELLVELLVPIPAPRSAGAYLRFIPREEMDIAVAGVGSFLAMTEDGQTCQHARIALAAVAPTPVRAREAEQRLLGRFIDDEAIRQAGELAAQAARPISDVRGSAAYRRELVKVLTRRTLRQALDELRR